MEPLKARIWDGQKMHYSDPHLQGNHGHVEVCTVYTGYEDSDEWDNYYLMPKIEYPLIDNLYDEDIVRMQWYHNNGLSESIGYAHITFEGYYIGVRLVENDAIIDIKDYNISHIEIIGNRFETPELLDR
jgi:hypothetical protein